MTVGRCTFQYSINAGTIEALQSEAGKVQREGDYRRAINRSSIARRPRHKIPITRPTKWISSLRRDLISNSRTCRRLRPPKTWELTVFGFVGDFRTTRISRRL